MTKVINYVFAIGIFLSIIILTSLSLVIIGKWIYDGDYKISKMWIESNSYCDNCLWIEFYEGCNRYKTYYFENQHELDKRLEIGMPVDISFYNCGDKKCIKEVIPRQEYANKC